MECGLWHYTGDSDQDHPHGKEMQKKLWNDWDQMANGWNTGFSSVRNSLVTDIEQNA